MSPPKHPSKGLLSAVKDGLRFVVVLVFAVLQSLDIYRLVDGAGCWRRPLRPWPPPRPSLAAWRSFA